jgi:hypothetical protein
MSADSSLSPRDDPPPTPAKPPPLPSASASLATAAAASSAAAGTASDRCCAEPPAPTHTRIVAMVYCCVAWVWHDAEGDEHAHRAPMASGMLHLCRLCCRCQGPARRAGRLRRPTGCWKQTPRTAGWTPRTRTGPASRSWAGAPQTTQGCRTRTAATAAAGGLRPAAGDSCQQTITRALGEEACTSCNPAADAARL